VLTACGYPVTEEHLIERFCGMSDAEMLGIIASDRGRPLPPSYTSGLCYRDCGDSGPSQGRMRAADGGTGSSLTLRWRRQSGANPSLK
jgi:hypothetical protein